MEELMYSAALYQKKILAEGEFYLTEFSALPNMNFFCEACSTDNTFHVTMINNNDPNDYIRGIINPTTHVQTGSTYRITYQCQMCKSFNKDFLVRFLVEKDVDHDIVATYGIKVGQYPSVSVLAEKAMKGYLNSANLAMYKHGLINESQGYGVGAFAYYRQLVENQIDTLLDDILSFAESSKETELSQKIDQAKGMQDTAKKIELVKEFLPSSLQFDNINVLKQMYALLSDGLHNKSDEECLAMGQELRACLVYLVRKISDQKKDELAFKNALTNLGKFKLKSKELTTDEVTVGES